MGNCISCLTPRPSSPTNEHRRRQTKSNSNTPNTPSSHPLSTLEALPVSLSPTGVISSSVPDVLVQHITQTPPVFRNPSPLPQQPCSNPATSHIGNGTFKVQTTPSSVTERPSIAQLVHDAIEREHNHLRDEDPSNTSDLIQPGIAKTTATNTIDFETQSSLRSQRREVLPSLLSPYHVDSVNSTSVQQQQRWGSDKQLAQTCQKASSSLGAFDSLRTELENNGRDIAVIRDEFEAIGRQVEETSQLGTSRHRM